MTAFSTSAYPAREASRPRPFPSSSWRSSEQRRERRDCQHDKEDDQHLRREK